MGGLVVQLFSANFTTRNPLDHRLMQRLSGTAMDFLVVAAISTINVEVVLGEFVRCFHRPPGNSSPTRRSTAGGGGTRKPARDPIGYGREARFRPEVAGQSLKKSIITDPTWGLLSRGSQVRILPGAPVLPTFRGVSPWPTQSGPVSTGVGMRLGARPPCTLTCARSGLLLVASKGSHRGVLRLLALNAGRV